jgi:hypothetical protein
MRIGWHPLSFRPATAMQELGASAFLEILVFRFRTTTIRANHL